MIEIEEEISYGSELQYSLENSLFENALFQNAIFRKNTVIC